jgi:fumarate reductase flavoprotein subunit
VAHPHGVLITWGLMMEGGVQVNTLGQRFQNEHRGYSEAAVDVLAQPGGVAWCVYDARLHDFAVGFPDYRDAVAAGAVLEGATAETLADAAGLPVNALAETLEAVSRFQKGEKDPLGRDFTGKPPLQPPYRAIKVTGALFHTQGGLMIDRSARVLRPDRTALPNLFAGGGAACGVSGPEISGYLSGAGLLTAVAFGYVAGEAAARLVR